MANRLNERLGVKTTTRPRKRKRVVFESSSREFAEPSGELAVIFLGVDEKARPEPCMYYFIKEWGLSLTITSHRVRRGLVVWYAIPPPAFLQANRASGVGFNELALKYAGLAVEGPVMIVHSKPDVPCSIADCSLEPFEELLPSPPKHLPQ